MTNPGNTDTWQSKVGHFIRLPHMRSQREPLKMKQDVMQLFYAHSGPVIAAVAWICIPATLKGALNWMEL